MKDTDLLQLALGLTAPLGQVSKVVFGSSQSQLTMMIDFSPQLIA